MTYVKYSVVVFFALLFGCTAAPQQSAPSMPASTPGPVPVAISLKQVADAFTAANLPVTKTIIYDERTDPNALLGRPNTYVEKMNFTDKRLKDQERPNCTIEIFTNETDAKTRRDYVEAIGKGSPMFGTYNYLHHNVLVRIDLKLIPSEAAEYKAALETL